jgi:hypothetical protein
MKAIPKRRIKKITWKNDLELPPQMDKWLRKLLSDKMTEFANYDLRDVSVHLDFMHPERGIINFSDLDLEIPFSFDRALDMLFVCDVETGAEHPDGIAAAWGWIDYLRAFADKIEQIIPERKRG